MEQSDAELLEGWRNGDLGAGELLFERYYSSIERFFLNKVTTGVGDLVQETFAACVTSRDRLVNGNKFRAYIFTVAYNVLCAHLRGRYRDRGQLDVDTTSIHDVSPGPSSVAVRRREQRLLLEGLRGIPIAYQMILELHYWEDMRTADIARILELPVGTVRSRMRRARELLNDTMTRLMDSPAVLESTTSQLDDWARKCRNEIQRAQVS